MIAKGFSVNGRIVLEPDSSVMTWLSRHEGEPLSVTLEALLLRRSIPQNKRMWAGYSNLLKRASVTCKLSTLDIHEAMKERSEVIEPARIYLPSGEAIAEIKSTRNLSVPKMCDYQEEVGAYFAQHGVDLWPEKEP